MRFALWLRPISLLKMAVLRVPSFLNGWCLNVFDVFSSYITRISVAFLPLFSRASSWNSKSSFWYWCCASWHWSIPSILRPAAQQLLFVMFLVGRFGGTSLLKRSEAIWNSDSPRSASICESWWSRCCSLVLSSSGLKQSPRRFRSSWLMHVAWKILEKVEHADHKGTWSILNIRVRNT